MHSNNLGTQKVETEESEVWVILGYVEFEVNLG